MKKRLGSLVLMLALIISLIPVFGSPLKVEADTNQAVPEFSTAAKELRDLIIQTGVKHDGSYAVYNGDPNSTDLSNLAAIEALDSGDTLRFTYVHTGFGNTNIAYLNVFIFYYDIVNAKITDNLSFKHSDDATGENASGVAYFSLDYADGQKIQPSVIDSDSNMNSSAIEDQLTNAVPIMMREWNGIIKNISGEKYNIGNIGFSKYCTPNAVTATKEANSSTKFTDVPASAYYANAVDWAVKNNITVGTGNGKFSPNANCKRGQMMQFLYNLAGKPEVTGDVSFADVPADAFYRKALTWAVQQKIADEGTTFRPDAPCTRGDMVVFMYRMKGQPVVRITQTFKDIDADSSLAMAVAWAKNVGVTSGKTATTFAPDDVCTRGQMATFLYRYANNSVANNQQATIAKTTETTPTSEENKPDFAKNNNDHYKNIYYSQLPEEHYLSNNSITSRSKVLSIEGQDKNRMTKLNVTCQYTSFENKSRYLNIPETMYGSEIHWKLLDANGVIIRSGVISKTHISVGDTYTYQISLNNLDANAYYQLVFYDEGSDDSRNTDTYSSAQVSNITRYKTTDIQDIQSDTSTEKEKSSVDAEQSNNNASKDTTSTDSSATRTRLEKQLMSDNVRLKNLEERRDSLDKDIEDANEKMAKAKKMYTAFDNMYEANKDDINSTTAYAQTHRAKYKKELESYTNMAQNYASQQMSYDSEILEVQSRIDETQAKLNALK